MLVLLLVAVRFEQKISLGPLEGFDLDFQVLGEEDFESKEESNWFHPKMIQQSYR